MPIYSLSIHLYEFLQKQGGGSLNIPVDEATFSKIPRSKFQTRFDDILLGREPSLRDSEYLEHSSLFGPKYVQGGAGEGRQLLKPDGSVENLQVIKSDSILPAYCDPPNPCPIGYTGEYSVLNQTLTIMVIINLSINLIEFLSLI